MYMDIPHLRLVLPALNVSVVVYAVQVEGVNLRVLHVGRDGAVQRRQVRLDVVRRLVICMQRNVTCS